MIALLSVLVVLGLIAFHNTPRNRQIRARRRAERQRVAAREQLSLACQKLQIEAFESTHLRYQQDVLWIEWHSKLADPECEYAGKTLALLTPEQIAKDPTMGDRRLGIGRYGMGQMAFSSYRMVDLRKRVSS